MKRIIILALACSAAAAHAEDRAAAEKYFRAGAKAYAAQNFEAAATDFDEAYKALPMPEIAFSAAQAYRRLYHIDPKPPYVRRAVELYRAYLDKVKTGGRVGDASDNLAEMEKELDKLKAQGASMQMAPAVEHTRLGVSITVAGETSALHEIGDAAADTMPGLHATLDGKPIAPFALVDTDPKEHVISVAADGYFPVDKKVMAVQGQSQLIEVELRPKPAKVTVKTESDARITVDGRGMSNPLELGPGTHLITVLHRGREPFSREITVARGQELTVPAPLHKTGRRRAVPWLLAGSGLLAAGAIATGVTAFVHDGRASDLHDQIVLGNRPASDGDRYDDEVAARDRYKTATWALGGAAVVTGAVALGLYFFDSPQPGERALVPTVSPNGGGVSLVGQF